MYSDYDWKASSMSRKEESKREVVDVVFICAVDRLFEFIKVRCVWEDISW